MDFKVGDKIKIKDTEVKYYKGLDGKIGIIRKVGKSRVIFRIEFLDVNSDAVYEIGDGMMGRILSTSYIEKIKYNWIKL